MLRCRAGQSAIAEQAGLAAALLLLATTAAALARSWVPSTATP
ncbi:MAG TPA: hypothetical protein VMV92_31345 [Streptosporangiaceae bacterium]|nr:hypothetical protein [Streptosporangiaceae bacterium]